MPGEDHLKFNGEDLDILSSMPDHLQTDFDYRLSHRKTLKVEPAIHKWLRKYT